MTRPKPVEAQVVVVFGASSGIGRAAALKFARRGASVVVASRGTAELQALVSEIEAAGGRGLAVVAEASEFAQVEAVAARAIERFGRINTWVQLAAVSIWSPFRELKPDEFRRVIDVNLNGAAYGAMVALRQLSPGGALIMVSSVEGVVALPYQSAYAASKFGMRGLTEAIRLEIDHERLPVRLTEILPSTINTPFYSKARTKLGVQPMGVPPLYQPEPVASAIVYAASNPVREIIAGGTGGVLIALKRFAPRFLEVLLHLIAFRLQRSALPKGPEAPDNLYAHLPGYARVRGDYSPLSFRGSLYTWLQTRPLAGRALAGAALALAIGAATTRSEGARRKQHP